MFVKNESLHRKEKKKEKPIYGIVEGIILTWRKVNFTRMF